MCKICNPKEFSYEKMVDYLYLMDSFYTPKISSLKPDLEEYAKKLCNNAYIVTMEENEKIAGLCAVYINNKFAFVSTIGVIPEFQKKGVAKKIFLSLEQLAVKSKLNCIKLEVYSNNMKAINFYNRVGFEKETQENNKIKMTYLIKRNLIG